MGPEESEKGLGHFLLEVYENCKDGEAGTEFFKPLHV